MGTLLRFPYEVRSHKDYFDDIPDTKLGKDAMDLAKHIVQTKAGHFHPEKFEDHYEKALRDLIRKKQAGEQIEAPKLGPPAKVINLMDALRQSLAGAETKKPPAPSQRRRQQSSPSRDLERKCTRHTRSAPDSRSHEAAGDRRTSASPAERGHTRSNQPGGREPYNRISGFAFIP